jgi:transposase
LTGVPGFRKKTHGKAASIPQRRVQAPVAEEFLAGETLHGLAKRHDLCRNLIRVWVAKYEAGAFDDDGGGARPSAYGGRAEATRRFRARWCAAAD